MYILYSIKMQGYWSGYNYTSDLNEAQKYERNEAITVAAKRYDERGYGLIPIALEDLRAIREYPA